MADQMLMVLKELFFIKMEPNKMQTLWKNRSMYQEGAIIQDRLTKIHKGKEKESLYQQMAVYSLENTIKT